MKYYNILHLKRLMGIPYINDISRPLYTYRTPFKTMNAEEFGADIFEDWSQYEERRATNPNTHRRHLNVHGIISYSTLSLFIGYYTDENGHTENIAAALYGYSRTTSKQITKLLQNYYKIITKLLQNYYKSITKVLQKYYKIITKLLQNYYKSITKFFVKNMVRM